MDATIVYGVNHDILKANHRIVSAASCTTNCVVPVLDILDRNWGVENGLMTTIHSAMNDQPMVDSPNAKNLRLSRSGLQSIIPVETSLSNGIERLLPHMAGKFDCLHVRVPTMNVSALDLSINLQKPATVEEINTIFKGAGLNGYKGLIGYSEEPHASIDFNHDPHSCVVDGTQTKVNSGTSVKMLCWFDNEWGFANRMLDVAEQWLKA
jgi:D-erythrose 4-phosphate dehydrogenase